jgi:heterodisulfide reductase subunit C
VRPQEVVFAFRRYQANDLAISTSAFGPLMSFYETGHAVTVKDAATKREQVGLDGNPPTSLNDEEAQKELQALLDASPMGELGIF